MKKARPVVVTVRLSEEEHRRFLAIAKKCGLSVASLIRIAVLERGTS
jgi:hypothetical protein